MALKASFLIAYFLLTSFTSAADEGSYEACNYDFRNPLEFHGPQLVKIKAGGTEECEVHLVADDEKYVELIFTELDLGNLTMDYTHQNACKPEGGGAEVYVLVSDYDWSYRTLGQRICGQTNQLTPEQRYRRSTKNAVALLFSNNIGRFQVQFNVVDTPGEAVCPESAVELSGGGIIKFPPKGVELLLNRKWCEWRITVPEGKKIKLHFRNMHVGDDISHPYGRCVFVGLYVFDGTDKYDWTKLLQQFCHQKIGKNVTELESTGNVMYVVHNAYEGFTGTSFEVEYEEI